MLRQSFMQIPEELLEAARLDQASEWQIIRHIMVPMARPTIVTLMLLTFISRWNDYFWPLVMTTNDKAVSYTHLDVYKRQEGNFGKENGNHICGCIGRRRFRTCLHTSGV